MNTYTVRALTTTDAALVKEAAERLAIYHGRVGLTRDNDLTGIWDVRQAAVLAVQLQTALEIIERITRP